MADPNLAVTAANEAASSGVLGTLGINGKLFLAQLVNFGVILFVLWRWAYKPLLKLMAERSAKIEGGLRDAEIAKQALAASEAEARALLKNAKREASAILESANAQASKTITEAKAKAKSEVEQVVSQGKATLEREKSDMIASAEAELGQLVVSATAKLLGKSVDADMDEKLVAAIVRAEMK